MALTVVSAVVVAAVVAAGVVGLGRVLGARRGPGGSLPWWTAAAVGLAYAAGHLGVARPRYPFAEVTDRLPLLALAAAALAAFEAARPRGFAVKAVGRVPLAGLTLWLILGPVVTAGEVEPEMKTRLAVSAAAALAAWACVEALAARPVGPEVACALLVTAGGAAVALVLSHSLVLGQLAVALAAALAGARLAARGGWPAGYVPAALAVLTGLVLEGHVYASLPGAPALLLAAAPASAWLARLGPVRRRGAWAVASAATLAALVPVGVAVGLAVSASPGDGY